MNTQMMIDNAALVFHNKEKAEEYCSILSDGCEADESFLVVDLGKIFRVSFMVNGVHQHYA